MMRIRRELFIDWDEQDRANEVVKGAVSAGHKAHSGSMPIHRQTVVYRKGSERGALGQGEVEAAATDLSTLSADPQMDQERRCARALSVG